MRGADRTLAASRCRRRSGRRPEPRIPEYVTRMPLAIVPMPTVMRVRISEWVIPSRYGRMNRADSSWPTNIFTAAASDSDPLVPNTNRMTTANAATTRWRIPRWNNPAVKAATKTMLPVTLTKKLTPPGWAGSASEPNTMDVPAVLASRSELMAVFTPPTAARPHAVLSKINAHGEFEGASP